MCSHSLVVFEDTELTVLSYSRLNYLEAGHRYDHSHIAFSIEFTCAVPSLKSGPVAYPELVSRVVSKSRKSKWLVKVGARKAVNP